jgi:hypothetical protein
MRHILVIGLLCQMGCSAKGARGGGPAVADAPTLPSVSAIVVQDGPRDAILFPDWASVVDEPEVTELVGARSSVAFQMQVPADPCGDAWIYRSGDDMTPQRLSQEMRLTFDGDDWESALASVEFDVTGRTLKVAPGPVYDRNAAGIDLLMWLSYPHYADGQSDLRFTATTSPLAGTWDLEASSGTWALEGTTLQLIDSDGNGQRVLVGHVDGVSEIEGVSVDDTYPYFWFRWGHRVFVSQALTAC